MGGGGEGGVLSWKNRYYTTDKSSIRHMTVLFSAESMKHENNGRGFFAHFFCWGGCCAEGCLQNATLEDSACHWSWQQRIDDHTDSNPPPSSSSWPNPTMPALTHTQWPLNTASKGGEGRPVDRPVEGGGGVRTFCKGTAGVSLSPKIFSYSQSSLYYVSNEFWSLSLGTTQGGPKF